jgi:hypothetical protein
VVNTISYLWRPTPPDPPQQPPRALRNAPMSISPDRECRAVVTPSDVITSLAGRMAAMTLWDRPAEFIASCVLDRSHRNRTKPKLAGSPDPDSSWARTLSLPHYKTGHHLGEPRDQITIAGSCVREQSAAAGELHRACDRGPVVVPWGFPRIVVGWSKPRHSQILARASGISCQRCWFAVDHIPPPSVRDSTQSPV